MNNNNNSIEDLNDNFKARRKQLEEEIAEWEEENNEREREMRRDAHYIDQEDDLEEFTLVSSDGEDSDFDNQCLRDDEVEASAKLFSSVSGLPITVDQLHAETEQVATDERQRYQAQCVTPFRYVPNMDQIEASSSQIDYNNRWYNTLFEQSCRLLRRRDRESQEEETKGHK
jgi:hypothetical protein